jgi:dephospho-CoA kinase
MHVIGLTGGIACGKTTVAQLFVSHNIPVVDADQVARDVVLPGTDGLAAVVQRFGTSVLTTERTLDRKQLGSLVFSDPTARTDLNAILHPRIAAESARRIIKLGARGHPFVLYDAALLVENDTYKQFEGLVVVTAQPEVQRRRLMARDGITEAEARSRIDAQWPLERKVAVATHVIDNSGSHDELKVRFDVVFADLCSRYGSPATKVSP